MGMAIDLDQAIEIIEEKQKELCPVGRYGRNYVYGSDREKYDAWEEIIDALDALPTLPQPSNEPPPCYQPDGDGCAYQCYDGDDEPIDKCKECPLCYSDKQRHKPSNEALTLSELREMDKPVWVACKPIEGGNGYWCLCRHGHIITPAGSIYDVKEIPHWVFYRRPPEGEDGDVNHA